MGKRIRLDVIVPDKYIKCNLYNPMDDLFYGAVRSLRDQGKSCEFLGFNSINGHVAVIDGIKYYTEGIRTGNPEEISCESFYVVDDAKYDYIDHRLEDRVNQILEAIKDS